MGFEKEACRSWNRLCNHYISQVRVVRALVISGKYVMFLTCFPFCFHVCFQGIRSHGANQDEKGWRSHKRGVSSTNFFSPTWLGRVSWHWSCSPFEAHPLKEPEADMTYVRPQAITKLLDFRWLFDLLAFLTSIFFTISDKCPLSTKLVQVISDLGLGLM